MTGTLEGTALHMAKAQAVLLDHHASRQAVIDAALALVMYCRGATDHEAAEWLASWFVGEQPDAEVEAAINSGEPLCQGDNLFLVSKAFLEAVGECNNVTVLEGRGTIYPNTGIRVHSLHRQRSAL